MRPLLVAGILIVVSTATVFPQKRQTVGRRKTATPAKPFDYSSIAIPADEVLYDDVEETRWRLATTGKRDAHNSTTAAYYDKQGIKRLPNGHVQVWIKYVVSVSGVEKQAYNLNLVEYDCSEKKNRTLSLIQYDEDGQATAPISEYLPSKWDYVVPATLAEAVLDIVCFGEPDDQQVKMDTASRWYRLGRLAEKRGQYLQAISYYQKAQDVDPDNEKIKEAIIRVATVKK